VTLELFLSTSFPGGISSDGHVHLVTVGLHLFSEMSYDPRLFIYGLMGVLKGFLGVEVGFNGAGGFLLAFLGVSRCTFLILQ
jgi:hypothetical protein